jgi:ankyrin repeat protein
MLSRSLKNSLFEALFYNVHSRIINRMASIDYPVNAGGMCVGIECMGGLAILAEDLDTYNERLKRLEQSSPAELAVRVHEVKLKQRYLIKIAKSDALAEVELKSEMKLSSFNENSSRLQKNILDEKLKRIEDNLTQEEKFFLEVPAFFDNVQIITRPYLHYQFLEKQPTSLQNIDDVLPFIISKKLEESGGVKRLDERFSGVYTHTELNQFFLILQNEFRMQPVFNHPFFIRMSNEKHGISVSYHFTKQCWVLIDANQLPVKYFDLISEFCQKIYTAFSCKEMAIFTTTFFTTQKHHDALKNKIDNLKNSPAWKGMHRVTRKKAASSDGHGTTWLDLSAELGNIDLMHEILATGAVSTISRSLFCAADNGNLNTINVLLQNNDFSKEIDKTMIIMALNIAAINGHIRIINALIEYYKGSDHTDIINIGLTAACYRGHTDVVKRFLALNINFSKLLENPVSRVALGIACQQEHFDIVNILLEQGAKVDQPGDKEITPLMMACMQGNSGIINLLLKYKPNVNLLDAKGNSALTYACLGNKIDVVKTLLNAGVNLNLFNKRGLTALIASCISGSIQILQELLSRDVAVNATSGIRTIDLIQHALENGCKHKKVEKLLNKNYKITTPDYIYGFSALHMAAYYGHTDLVRMLLDNHSDPRLTSDNNISVLEMAQVMGHREIATIITIQSYVLLKNHSDSYRRNAVNKFLQLANETQTLDSQENVIAVFVEIDTLAQQLATIYTTLYKTDNSQRIGSLNAINDAIIQAYRTYVEKPQDEMITNNLKSMANETALLVKKDHEKNSYLYRLFGKKSLLATTISHVIESKCSSYHYP